MSETPTKEQVSAGGVVFRRAPGGEGFEAVVVSVGPQNRWQLPKGLIDAGEMPEQAAAREVREEAGVVAELVRPLGVVEYWYFSGTGARRVRFHKLVHFFLFRYVSGETSDHDREVNEALWVKIEDAAKMLAFKGERETIGQARAALACEPV